MKKRPFLIASVIIASAVLDFYRGYRETKSVLSGFIWALGGLIVLAIIWWLYSNHQPSKTN
jgi:hypothetical protein